jgi:hypothetical protein
MKAMNLLGAKVKLQVNEPWDAYRVLTCKLVRPITFSQGGNYYLLECQEEPQWLVIAIRLKGDRIEDIFLGRGIDVGVASVKDVKVLDTGHFDMTQVDYIWIATISLEEPGNVET